MKQIIYNQVNYGKELFETNDKTLNLSEIYYLCKYLNYLGYSENDKRELLYNKYVNQKDFSGVNNIIRKVKDEKIVEPNKIIIYKEELNILDDISNENLRNVLFIILCLSKFYNNKGILFMKSKTPTEFNSIVKLADCKFKKIREERKGLLAKLGQCGLIDMPYANMCVLKYCKDNGKVELEFYVDTDMIYHYYKYLGINIKECQHCGKYYKPNSNSQKLCKECRNAK